MEKRLLGPTVHGKDKLMLSSKGFVTVLVLIALVTAPRAEGGEIEPGNAFGVQSLTFTNGQPAGRLLHVVIDWNTGRPEFAVINSEDDTQSANANRVVPWHYFKFGGTNDTPRIGATREQLGRTPALVSANTQPFQDSAILSEARRYYSASGSADSGLSGTLRGSGSSTSGDSSDLGGSRAAPVVVYIGAALLLGIVAACYLLGRRSGSPSASPAE